MVFGLFVLNGVYNFVSVLNGCDFVICPKQGAKMKGVVLNRVVISGYFRAFSCPKHDQSFKRSAAALISPSARDAM